MEIYYRVLSGVKVSCSVQQIGLYILIWGNKVSLPSMKEPLNRNINSISRDILDGGVHLFNGILIISMNCDMMSTCK